MSLYYQDDLVELHLGDCRGIRGWLSADVLVTDPPYGVAYVSNRGFQKSEPISGDKSPEIRDDALEMWGDRPALVFGRWDITRPAGTRHRLIWDKGPTPGMGDLSMPWGRSEEEIYVLGRGFVGRREPNVIRAQMLMSGDARRPRHPTPKPVALMEALIAKCPPGVVADPFAGSGSTLIAARNLGRRAIGIEIDERYCEMTVKRLAQQAFDFGDSL